MSVPQSGKCEVIMLSALARRFVSVSNGLRKSVRIAGGTAVMRLGAGFLMVGMFAGCGTAPRPARSADWDKYVNGYLDAYFAFHPDIVFFIQAEDGIRDLTVTGVQTCALPI